MIWLWVWGLVTAINLMIEFLVSNLFTLWFSAGGLVTLLVVALVPEMLLIWQFAIFIGVSVLLLLGVRKICVKLLNKNEKISNK